MDETAFAKQQVFVLLSCWSIKLYKIKCVWLFSWFLFLVFRNRSTCRFLCDWNCKALPQDPQT